MFIIKELNLLNFRCYKKHSIKFSPHINILVGDNAVGKTSIVEAIYCLGFTKSHKANLDSDMIRKGEEYSVIKATFTNDSKIEELIFSITKKGKRIQKNNKTYKQLSEYIGYFNVVIFCPEDLEIIKGSPGVRRKFLDVNISQINPSYLNSSINYRKLLKQRNEILKNINENTKYDHTLLNIVTEELMKVAINIIEERKKFISRLNPYLSDKCKLISDDNEYGILEYLPNVNSNGIKTQFDKQLKIDIATKTTTVGPHRDDFSILINGEYASSYGSQGQQRTMSLAIKLALADLIKENSKNLIIILDDVFSELDINRQNQILKLISQNNQIFITTTSVDNLSTDLLNKSNVVTIHKEVDEIGR